MQANPMKKIVSDGMQEIDMENKKKKMRLLFFLGPCLAAMTAVLMFAGVNSPGWLLFVIAAIAIPSSACHVTLGCMQFFKTMKGQGEDKDQC